MRVSVADFVQSPAIYLDKVECEKITITRDGVPIAVLVYTRCSSTHQRLRYSLR